MNSAFMVLSLVMKRRVFRQNHILSIYNVKALSSPRGAYLISDLPEDGLLERGGLFKKLCDKDIFGSFSVLLLNILLNQHTILRFKYVTSTHFYLNHTKINLQGCVAK